MHFLHSFVSLLLLYTFLKTDVILQSANVVMPIHIVITVNNYRNGSKMLWSIMPCLTHEIVSSKGNRRLFQTFRLFWFIVRFVIWICQEIFSLVFFLLNITQVMYFSVSLMLLVFIFWFNTLLQNQLTHDLKNLINLKLFWTSSSLSCIVIKQWKIKPVGFGINLD